MCRVYVVFFMLLTIQEIPLVKSLQTIESEDQLVVPINRIENWERPGDMGTCLLYNCTITCIKTSSETLETKINNTLSFSSYCSIIEKLQLISLVLPNGTLPQGFLGSYQNRVRSLVLTNSNIVNIDPGAFVNGIFEQLTFENLNLYALRAKYFQNITDKLVSLTIIQTNNNEMAKFVEDDFLWPIRPQLKVLRVHANEKCVDKFVSTGGFGQLTNLDLQYNDLRNRLKFNTFMKFKVLRYLNLAQSKISFLPSLIFSYLIDTLIFLDISGNQLTTLYPMIFGYQQIPAMPTINAKDNPYVCSCQLYNHFVQLFPQMVELNCYNQKTRGMVPVSIKLCFLDYNVGEILHSEETTELSGNALIHNNCKNIMHSMNNSNIEVSFHNELNVVENLLFLSSAHNEPELEPQGLVVINGRVPKFYHLPNNTNFNVNHTIYEENSPYTVCVIYDKNLQLNPLDCTSSYRRGLAGGVSQRGSWLTLNDKITAISFVLLSLFAFMFIGLSATVVILQRYPNLIGSKKLKKPPTHVNDMTVMPKRASKKDYFQKKKQSLVKIDDIPEDAASLASADSYMCNNIYELVPAYLKLRDEPFKSDSCVFDTENYNRLPPMEGTHRSSYAFTPSHHHHLHHISSRDVKDPIPQSPPPHPPMLCHESYINGQSDIYDF